MAWSENYKYKNPDITGLVDNVKKMMGVDSGAGGRRSRNMSDYLTGAKTEGQLSKNVKFKALADLIERFQLDPSLSDKEKFSMFSCTGSGDIETGYTKRDVRPSVLRKSVAEADVAEQKAGIGGLREGLAKQIAAMGLPVNIGDYDRGNPNEMQGYSNALDKQQIDSETLEALAQRFGVLGDKPHTTTTDVAGSKGERITTGKVGLFEARTTAAKNLGVANVELANKRTSEVIERMGLAGKLNAEKIKEIQDRVLINWNQGFQKATTAKKRRELLDQEIKTEIQKTLGAKETVAKKTIETEMSQLELDELPTTLSFKRETLRQKKRKAAELARIAETDAKAEPQLKALEIEIAELDKAIKEHGKGKAEIQKDTAGIKKETATAQKDRAVTLSEMSTLEKNALPKKILDEAKKLEGEIKKDEATILKIQAQTQTEGAARQLKITQNRLNHNKDVIQKLLAPHVRKFAEERATNEAEKFANQMKLKMIPTPKAPLPLKGREIDNWGTEDDVGEGGDQKLDRRAYAEVEADLLLQKDKIKAGMSAQQINQILAVIIKKMNVTTKEAKIIYDEMISGF